MRGGRSRELNAAFPYLNLTNAELVFVEANRSESLIRFHYRRLPNAQVEHTNTQRFIQVANNNSLSRSNIVHNMNGTVAITIRDNRTTNLVLIILMSLIILLLPVLACVRCSGYVCIKGGAQVESTSVVNAIEEFQLVPLQPTKQEHHGQDQDYAEKGGPKQATKAG
ncbi:Hypothetical predicted protein [Olea europaea subsp. europaea]|uniref:Uncharacterized protein n=1 Tax=Olea europaea subsp. europaea TaxID=158383 RepID=A0A8S0VL80_OLEEU|nr:Hypothetical predicted protein [Olea europaea subsp. europaea]